MIKDQLSIFAPMKTFSALILIKVYTSIVLTFMFQINLDSLHINKVGECYLTSIVCRQYFSIIFNK